MSLGAFSAGSLVDLDFNTRSAGVFTTLVGGAVSIYKDNSSTESILGVTLTTDFDGKTGFHHVRIDTSADSSFYAAGSSFTVVLTAGTVGGASAFPSILDDFRLYTAAQAAAIAAIPVTITPAAGAITFEAIWRVVLGHCPIAGAGLAREWTQWAYDEFCLARNDWSHLRVQSAISVAASRSGTAVITQGSAAVTAGTLTFTSADIGRQLRYSGNAIYTIIAVPGGNATLDRVWAETGGTLTVTVLDAYVTMPADFARFYAVIDPSQQWRLHYHISSEILNRIDPIRTSAGSPRILANATLSPISTTLGQVRYEVWPFVTTARIFPMWYFKSGGILTDDTVLSGVLANQKSVLVEGALSRAALWPGLENRKNSYFSLPLAQVHEAKFREKITMLHVRSDEVYFEGLPLTDMAYADWPYSADWLQSHVPEMIG